jgi:hypothetical protein
MLTRSRQISVCRHAVQTLCDLEALSVLLSHSHNWRTAYSYSDEGTPIGEGNRRLILP